MQQQPKSFSTYKKENYIQNQLKNENDELKAKTTSNTLINQLKSEKKELEEKIEHLEYLLEIAVSEAQKVEKVENENKSLKENQENLIEENQKLNEKIKIMENKVKEVRMENQSKNTEYSELNEEYQRIKKSREDLGAKLKLAEMRMIEAEEEQCNAEAECTTAKRELFELQKQYQISINSKKPENTDINKLKEELEAERLRTDGLVSALSEARSEASMAYAKLKQMEKSTMSIGAEKEYSENDTMSMSEISTSNETISNKEILKLKKQIASYKTSRDKLLFELDKQAVEIESLEADKISLLARLEESRIISNKMELEADLAIKRTENLKNMLDESIKSESNPKEALLMEEAAKAVELEQKLQEVTLAHTASEKKNLNMKSTWLPFLKEVEMDLIKTASLISN